MHRLVAPFALATVAACRIDTGLVKDEVDPTGFDSGTPAADTAATDTDTPAVPEECNGLDDDGDGAVDEDFPDTNANGRADCLDTECPPLDALEAGTVPIVAACEGSTSTRADAWNIVEEWGYDTRAGYGAVNVVAAGHLTDDDGDGVLGSSGDIPDLAYGDWRKPDDRLIVLSGDGSGVHFEYGPLGDYRGVAIADTDGDGWTEVLAYTRDDTVVALDSAGTVKWESAPFDYLWAEQFAVADLYGDGAPEVIADEAVLDGATGATVARLSSAQLYRSPTPADLDGDGVMEIVLGPDVYDAAGTPLWSTSSPATSDVFVALVQADGDASAELAFVDDDGYHLYDTDGLPILSAGLPSGQPYAYPGPPCVADFDGDGAPELGVATYDYFTVLELDGTLVWSVGVRDWGPKGCSGFDFDEDGAAEVIYADLLTLYVLDGRTGATLWSWADYSDNGQGSEYAFVADIDADGVAEIVTGVNDGPAQGVRVFGQVVGDWPGAGPAWGVHDFSETNQDDDGGVPASPTPPWDLGVFRARPTRASATADLTVSITDVCVADCEFGPVRLAIQVANQGAVTVAAGAEVEVVALDSTGERRVATVTLPEIAAGTRAVAAEVDLNPADVGALGFAAVIDVGGRIRECDETNNRDDWTEFFCP